MTVIHGDVYIQRSIASSNALWLIIHIAFIEQEVSECWLSIVDTSRNWYATSLGYWLSGFESHRDFPQAPPGTFFLFPVQIKRPGNFRMQFRIILLTSALCSIFSAVLNPCICRPTYYRAYTLLVCPFLALSPILCCFIFSFLSEPEFP